MIGSSGWQWKGAWMTQGSSVFHKCLLLPEGLSNCISLHHTDLQLVWNQLALVCLCVETSSTLMGVSRAKEISEDSSFVKKDEQWLDSKGDSLLFWLEAFYTTALARYTSSIYALLKIISNKPTACCVTATHSCFVWFLYESICLKRDICFVY